MFNKKLKIESPLQTVYCCVVFLAVFYCVIQNSKLKFFMNLPSAVYWGFIIIFGLLAFTKKTYYRSDIIYLFAVGLGAFSAYKSGSRVMLMTAVSVFAARGFDYNAIVKGYRTSLLSAIALVVLLEFLGLLPSIRSYVRNASASQVRYTFGFTHPNVFAMFVLALVCSYYFTMSNEKPRLIKLLPCALALGVTLLLSRSYTVAFVLAGLLVFLIILSAPFYNRLHAFVLRHTVFFRNCIIIFAVLLIGYVVYTSFKVSRLDVLDNMGSTAAARLYYANRAINEYGVSIFGQKIVTYGSLDFSTTNYNYFTIDCLYVLLLVRDGLIASLFFWYSLFKSVKKLFRWQCIVGTLLVALLLIYSIMETGLAFQCFGFVFAAPFAVLSNKKSKSFTLRLVR